MDDNHHWKLVPLDNGCFYIVNHFSGTYLSVENDGTKDGARIVIWEKKDGGEPAQQWKLVAADKKDGHFVRIINRASGLAMGVVGDSLQNGTPICLQPMNAATTVWRIDVPVASLKTAK
jgi:hypothetical protein